MNAPMPVSITVRQMLHVPTQRELTNVCVMMDIQATGRFVKVRNRPHVDQNIFQGSTHWRDHFLDLSMKERGFTVFPMFVYLSFLPSRYFIIVLLLGNHLT